MSLELRRRLMVQEEREAFDTVYRFMIGEGYTREQMTEICGVDIVSLFNEAKNTIVYNGKKYMKVTSCALPLNSTKINVPDVNSGVYWSPDAIYVFYENGVLKEKVFSGGSYTFTDTTSSKAIVYYARYHRKEKHVNFNSALYSQYSYLAYNKFIKVLWTFEPYDKYTTTNSYYNNNTLKQIHYPYILSGTPELRNCSGLYGVLHIKNKRGNMQFVLSALNSLTGIIVDASCGDLQNVAIGNFSSVKQSLRITIEPAAYFSFDTIYARRDGLDITMSEDALTIYTYEEGVLIKDGSIITASYSLADEAELVYGEEITSIKQNAFLFSGKVKKLDLSETQIKDLPAASLHIGETLEELHLPKALETLGSGSNLPLSYSIYAPTLEKITLPDTLITLRTGSIRSGNSTLHILDLPSNVKISGYSFNSFRIKELYLRWDTDEKIQTINHLVSWGVFSGATFVNCKLHIPKGMMELYEAKNYTTSIFKEIVDDL